MRRVSSLLARRIVAARPECLGLLPQPLHLRAHAVELLVVVVSDRVVASLLAPSRLRRLPLVRPAAANERSGERAADISFDGQERAAGARGRGLRTTDGA